ncbi:hypothetical protein NC651_020557 [Populus alba x Populus x berolinensis]|nr:hypothetical protein NC651_020557 [Populus alba x Populus x berolinensis]
MGMSVRVWTGPPSGKRITMVVWNRRSSMASISSYFSDTGPKSPAVINARDVLARLRVVDVNLANGTCSLPYKSVSVDEFMDDDHYSLDATTYTSFIKCSSNLSDKAYRLVPCLSGNGTNVYVSYVTYIISSLQGSCLFVSRVPTVYQAVLFPSYDSILQLMQTGFDLEWCIGWWYSSSSYGCYRSGQSHPKNIPSFLDLL